MFDRANYHPETPELILNMLEAADDCAVDEEWDDDIADGIGLTEEFIQARIAAGEDPAVIDEMTLALQGMMLCWNEEGDIDGYLAEVENVYNIVKDI